jgi:adenosylcobinamide kinase / adenosylcobinamide-phosphate guanylyltransferase
MAGTTLIVGGARSGKSSFALRKANELPAQRVFIATAVPIDEEMEERIRKHREERSRNFLTVEAPYDLTGALKKIADDRLTNTVVVDCLTVWLGNLFHTFKEDERKIDAEIERFIETIGSCDAHLFLVANEVGLGIVPETSMGRHFRDVAGRLNQQVAARADEVYLCVCGIPMAVKKVE